MGDREELLLNGHDLQGPCLSHQPQTMSRGHADSIISGSSGGDKDLGCHDEVDIGDREASITTQSTFTNNYQNMSAGQSSHA